MWAMGSWGPCQAGQIPAGSGSHIAAHGMNAKLLGFLERVVTHDAALSPCRCGSLLWGTTCR